MLDGWLAGSPQRLCREAPVPVVDVERVSYACGGAANAAANVAAPGGRASLAGVIGADRAGKLLRGCLRRARVDARLVTVRGRRTLAKRRVVGDDQILVRFDEGDSSPVPPAAVMEFSEVVAK